MPTAPIPLFDAVPVLRRLREDEAPYPGVLLSTSPPTVSVDLDLVPEAVWRCAPDGHVLVPVDVARTPSGHAAVVPHCTERIAQVVRRAVSPGHVVTLAVSMLRAGHEARRSGIDAGSWWLEEATGRPVLVAGGTHDWTVEASRILEELVSTTDAGLRAPLHAVAAILERPRCALEELTACEDALFAIAEPASLCGGNVTGLHAGTDDLSAAAVAPRRAASLRRDSGGIVAAATWSVRLLDAEWAHRTAAALSAIRRVPAIIRERRGRRSDGRSSPSAERRGDASEVRGVKPRRPRRVLWFVAAAAGTSVLALGLLWPDGDAAPDGVPMPSNSGDVVRMASSATSATTQQATPTAEVRAAVDDLEAAPQRALRGLRACSAAPSACRDVLEDPAAAAPQGAVADAEAQATLIDEYGGVVVYRIETSDATAQIMVLVRSDDTWLVRDVYDVADQP